MPLDQQIKGGHGEREPCLEIIPHTVHHLFEMADERQHRQHCLHQYAILPLAALTQCEVAWIPLSSMKGRITQDNHLLFELPNEPLKGVICDISGGTLPRHDQPPLIEQQTQFAADNPTVIGEAFPTDLLGTP